ncbi:MAG: cytochrome c family protein [Planctomycetes bacterium]|nr:cytochrome c family protein [Planctomycetota bacterium]
MSEAKVATSSNLIFPPWVDDLVKLIGLGAAFGGVYTVAIVWFGFSPKTTDVGYQPEQPVPYSHALHAGDLGLDCRYCHTGVESAARAAVPPTQTCMNCHSKIRPQSPLLEPVRKSYSDGTPVEWIRVHDLADFAYFNHSAHVTRGVGCVSCHGRIDRMERVYQAKTLSMGFCLECHRNPERHLRPLDKITDMEWSLPADKQRELGLSLMRERGLHDADGAPTWRLKRLESCSTCHR